MKEIKNLQKNIKKLDRLVQQLSFVLKEVSGLVKADHEKKFEAIYEAKSTFNIKLNLAENKPEGKGQADI